MIYSIIKLLVYFCRGIQWEIDDLFILLRHSSKLDMPLNLWLLPKNGTECWASLPTPQYLIDLTHHNIPWSKSTSLAVGWKWNAIRTRVRSKRCYGMRSLVAEMHLRCLPPHPQESFLKIWTLSIEIVIYLSQRSIKTKPSYFRVASFDKFISQIN